MTAKVSGPLARVGVPEITPVKPLSDRPGGNAGSTKYPSTGVDTAGVNAMASPTTAGKGCDPLYDNAGEGRVAGSRPPQAQSQDRPMNTPMRHVGITTQFARAELEKGLGCRTSAYGRQFKAHPFAVSLV